MRSFISDTDTLPGSDSSHVPSSMDNDPHADELVINQQESGGDAQDNYPTPIDESTQSGKIAPDDLAASIAYALDGSGPGPTNDKPNVSGHKVITEGITGAGPEEEEANLRS